MRTRVGRKSRTNKAWKHYVFDPVTSMLMAIMRSKDDNNRERRRGRPLYRVLESMSEFRISVWLGGRGAPSQPGRRPAAESQVALGRCVAVGGLQWE